MKEEAREELAKVIRLENENMNSELYEHIAENYWQMEKEDLKWLLLDFIFNSDEEITRKALKDYNERINDWNCENDYFTDVYNEYERLGLV